MKTEISNSPERIASPLTEQLLGVAASAKSLEQTLERERAYAQELKDYIAKQALHIRQIGESQQQLKKELTEFQSLEAASTGQIERLTGELNRTLQELAQYRGAWVQILKREEAARASQEGRAELERKIKTLESELALAQDARRALIQAETKMNEMSETTARATLNQEKLAQQIIALEKTLSKTKSDHLLEVAALETKLRAEHEIESTELKHKLLGNYSLEIARQKDSSRQSVQQEVERQLEAERSRLRAEFNSLVAQKEETISILAKKCSELDMKANQASQLESLQDKNALEIMRRQLDLARMSESKYRLQVERLEKQMSSLAIEHGIQQKILMQTIPADEQTLIEAKPVSTGIPIPKTFN